MPWLAQREGGHPHYADEGSQREAVFRRLGYVDVPAPGSDVPAEVDVDDFGEPVETVDTHVELGETFDRP